MGVWLRLAEILVLCSLSAIISSCSSQAEQKKVYPREGGTEREEYWPEGGPDAEAPARAGLPKESAQNVSDAITPTPTPNRPIDRPLDPTGLPVGAPTP